MEKGRKGGWYTVGKMLYGEDVGVREVEE